MDLTRSRSGLTWLRSWLRKQATVLDAVDVEELDLEDEDLEDEDLDDQDDDEDDEAGDEDGPPTPIKGPHSAPPEENLRYQHPVKDPIIGPIKGPDRTSQQRVDAGHRSRRLPHHFLSHYVNSKSFK